MAIKSPKHIVISRTDSIGDVVLTLPVAGILREEFPDAKITFLGNTYTKPVIDCCKNVDEVWEWATIDQLSYTDQINWFKEKNIDVFIHVFPRRELARVIKKAGIKHRIGTSHRVYHLITCNHRPNFTRKKSDLHEAQLNVKLLKPLGINKEYSLDELTALSGFSNIPPLNERFSKLISPHHKNIIFHAKSKGSALEWGVDNFVQLAKELDPDRFNIFFTGTEAEAAYFRDQLPDLKNIFDLSGEMSLTDLIAFISKADLLLAASTGPLHIAGVSGITAVGLFSIRKPIHAGRWKPLGKLTKIIEDKKNTSSTQPLLIPVRDVKKVIEDSLKK